MGSGRRTDSADTQTICPVLQVVVYLERLPDSLQRDHVNWGFHLTAFFGTDYRSTTNKGYFSGQLLDHDRRYGFDPVLECGCVLAVSGKGHERARGALHLHTVSEAQLTPNNYMFSHSLLCAVDPFTDTGVLATTEVNDQWVVQFGCSGSHDVALWTSNAKLLFTGCASYTTKSVNDNLYMCANGINDGQYAFNNLQMHDGRP